MKFDILSSRTGSAAENMAVDFLLLQRYERESNVRFRHYGWRSPAFTFGFSQKIAWVREQLPKDQPLELCRRATGGGIVDHRDDWTYSLVIPGGHVLYDARATQSYKSIHEALVQALRKQNQPVELKPCLESPAKETEVGPAGVCFQRAEIFDVVNTASGEKIAGAAQKRNKRGMLFQGSLWKPTVPGVDWDKFESDFTQCLSPIMQTPGEEAPWPDFPEGELEGLIEQYSSPEWLEYR